MNVHRTASPPPARYQTRGPHTFPLSYLDAGKGELLLLIHGSLCDYRYWKWQIPALGASHRVLSPSLRGYWPHAATGEDPTFSLAQHTADLLELVCHVAPGEPIHVLGHSRGAHVALEFAFQAPELTRTLTLADPGFRFEGEPLTPSFHSDVVELLKVGQIDLALERFVDAVNGTSTWRHMVSWFKSMVRDNAYTLLSQVRELQSSVDLNRVTALDCPVLLIGGADSPPRYADRLDALEHVLPAATRVSIPLAAHGMNLANPKAFNTAVQKFLDLSSAAS
jgi:pimeloyl-ACP methyl ester carboxylesterase